MHSNWTLRFPRTSREAFGYQIAFEGEEGDKLVFYTVMIGLAFVLGLFVGNIVLGGVAA